MNAENSSKEMEYYLQLYELKLKNLSIDQIAERLNKTEKEVKKDLEILEDYIKNKKIPEDYKEKFAEVRAKVFAEDWFKWRKEIVEKAAKEGKIKNLEEVIKDLESYKEISIEKRIEIYKKCF